MSRRVRAHRARRLPLIFQTVAIPSDAVWEIRESGNDFACGGGFSESLRGATGIDYSQQVVAQFEFEGSLNVNVTTVTDSGGGFDNTILGNAFLLAVQVSSGTSTGSNGASTLNGSGWTGAAFAASGSSFHRVTITGGTGSGQTRIIGNNTPTTLTVLIPWAAIPDATSTFLIERYDTFFVVAFIDNTQVTLDRAATGGTASGWIGGSLQSPGRASQVVAAGNQVHQKGGSYLVTIGGAKLPGGLPSLTVAVTWSGYEVVRGDMGAPPSIGLSAGISGVTVFSGSASGMLIENIEADAIFAIGTNGFSFNSGSGTLRRLRAVRVSDGIGFVSTNGQWVGHYCLSLNSLTGFSGGHWVDSVAFQSSSGHGFSSPKSVTRCAAISNAVRGFSITDSGVANECLAWGNGSHGFYATVPVTFLNCMSANNVGAGYNTSAGGFVKDCASFNNVGGGVTGPAVVDGLVVPSFDPFNNPLINDFSLNVLEDAGLTVRSRPAPLPGIPTISYHDIGVQAPSVSTGGGGSLVPFVSREAE